MLYVFKSLKLKAKFLFEKHGWKYYKFGFSGVKMAVKHFVSQFTHVSKHLGFTVGKKNVLRKLFWKCGIRCLTKKASLSTKLLLEKSAK